MVEEETKVTTVQEAGRKGGEARAEKYSKEELSDQAKRAAKTIENKEPGFHAEIGKKGGEARAEQYSKEELSEQAKRAAQTVEREHPGFHSEIGRKGGKSTNATKRVLSEDEALEEDEDSEDDLYYKENEDE